VKVELALQDGLALTIAGGAADAPVASPTDRATAAPACRALADRAPAARAAGPAYPTHRLQKGLLLSVDGTELAEEGVGFGVPILKRGISTVFPGAVALAERPVAGGREVTAVFAMDLVERLATAEGAAVGSKALYAAKNSLAALHRRAPALRGPLTAASNAVRRSMGWQTTFAAEASTMTLKATFTILEGREGVRVGVAVDLSGLPDDITEVVLMNELGARRFDRYVDGGGADLRGPAVGTWDLVTADRGSFVCDSHQVAFSLGQVAGATLHRGRELIGTRLAWSGFGYSLPPTLGGFAYELAIARTS
jgi:hypothetical protein